MLRTWPPYRIGCTLEASDPDCMIVWEGQTGCFVHKLAASVTSRYSESGLVVVRNPDEL